MQVFYKEQQHHFRLLNDVDVATSISLAHEFKTPYLAMSEAGHLKIKAGYRWSLPWYVYSHSPEWVKAVLVHDALYELIRLGVVTVQHKKQIDQLFVYLCKAAGVKRMGIFWVYFLLYCFVRVAPYRSL